MPMSKIDDPGIGLRDNGRRVLTYSDLGSTFPDPDGRDMGPAGFDRHTDRLRRLLLYSKPQLAIHQFGMKGIVKLVAGWVA